MQLLVTGGAGYIGSMVAERLLQAGHVVPALDNLSKGSRQAVPGQARLIVADTGDAAGLDCIFRRAISMP